MVYALLFIGLKSVNPTWMRAVLRNGHQRSRASVSLGLPKIQPKNRTSEKITVRLNM